MGHVDMRVLIVGATGRIGSVALERALAGGHEVVAIVRDAGRIEPQERLDVHVGDARDEDAMNGALTGIDAVIAAVGPRTNTLDDELALEHGMRLLVAAMTRHGVSRLVALSGAGVDVPGDQKPLVDRVMSRVVRVFARHVVNAKQREYAVLSASGLDWTALRPPLVSDGVAQGYRLELKLLPGARVRRADVGQALVDQLADPSFVHAAPFVLPPSDRGV